MTSTSQSLHVPQVIPHHVGAVEKVPSAALPSSAAPAADFYVRFGRASSGALHLALFEQPHVVRIVWILAFTFATAIAAHIKIPIPGSAVPMTLQTLFVVLAGLRLGRLDGALSQALYVGAGSIGLPFFANVNGIAALIGPTGGYLIGFILSAWTAGMCRGFAKSFFSTWLIAFVASLIVFVPGILQLKFFTQASWLQTIMMGFTPFIVEDLLKVSLAAMIYRLTNRTQ